MRAKGGGTGGRVGGGSSFKYTGASGKTVKAYRKTSKAAAKRATAPKPSPKPRPADDGWSRRPPMSTSTANKALNDRDARKKTTARRRSK
jgi:hypothetical protein